MGYLSQLPCLSVGSPDTLEMGDKFDKWFSIDTSLPFFLFRAANQGASGYLDHIQRPVYCKWLPSSLHSNFSNIKKDLSKDIVMKINSILQEGVCGIYHE